MASDLESQLVDLLKTAGGNTLASFTPDDRTDLEKYGLAVAKLVVQRRSTTDQKTIDDIDRQVKNYKGAVALMVDKYLLKAQDQASKASLAALKLVAPKVFDLLMTAVV